MPKNIVLIDIFYLYGIAVKYGMLLILKKNIQLIITEFNTNKFCNNNETIFQIVYQMNENEEK